MRSVFTDKDSLKSAVNELQTIICANVVAYCKENGIKQTDICRTVSALNISLDRSSLNQLYNGKYQRQLSLYTLIAICEATGKKWTDFIQIKQPDKEDK